MTAERGSLSCSPVRPSVHSLSNLHHHSRKVSLRSEQPLLLLLAKQEQQQQQQLFLVLPSFSSFGAGFFHDHEELRSLFPFSFPCSSSALIHRSFGSVSISLGTSLFKLNINPILILIHLNMSHDAHKVIIM